MTQQTIIKKPTDVVHLLTKLKSGSTMDLKATKLPSGEIAVVTTAASTGKKHKSELLKKYAHLSGVGITLSQAAERYDVPRDVISKWVYRTHDVSFAKEDCYPKLIDEAEVALCAEIYHKRKEAGALTGFPYFDEHGFYVEEMKHPHRSRRQKKAA